jgi:nitrilase
VQFAISPETVVPYYPYFSFVQAPLQNIAGPEQRKLLDQAVTVLSPATDANQRGRQAGGSRCLHRRKRAERRNPVNTQLLFDADGTLIQRCRKISPTYHERMIWGQRDRSGLRSEECLATVAWP